MHHDHSDSATAQQPADAEADRRRFLKTGAALLAAPRGRLRPVLPSV